MFDILRVVQFFFRRVLVVVFLEMVDLILVLCIAVVPRPQLHTCISATSRRGRRGGEEKKEKPTPKSGNVFPFLTNA